jgi:hypothetical protein
MVHTMMTLSITILSITILSIMILTIMILSITTVKIKLSIATLRITFLLYRLPPLLMIF